MRDKVTIYTLIHRLNNINEGLKLIVVFSEVRLLKPERTLSNSSNIRPLQ